MIFFVIWQSFVSILFAKQISSAERFVIVKPSDGVVGSPLVVTVEARAQGVRVDTDYQDDVTLETDGSATGGGLVDIVNGVGTISITDTVAETVTLTLSDTQGTGLDVSSSETATFAAIPPPESSTVHQTNFWFRDDDGSEGEATGFGPSDVQKDESLIDVSPSTNIRLRIALKALQQDAQIVPQLEYNVGSNCSGEGWTKVTQESDVAALHPSVHFLDGDATTQQISSAGSFVPGFMSQSANPAPATLIPKNDSTEYEWSLRTADSLSFVTTYAFRVTNDGQPLSGYQKCPTLTTEAPRTPPSSRSGAVAALTVKGIVQNDDDGTRREEDLFLSVDGVPVVNGQVNSLFPGTHQVDGVRWNGYALTFSGDCDERGFVSLVAGDEKTCTVTSDDIKGVLPEKNVPDLSSSRMSLRVSGQAYPGAQVTLIERRLQGNDLARFRVEVSESGSFEIDHAEIMSEKYAYSLMVKDRDGRQTQTKVYAVDFSHTSSVAIARVFMPPTVEVLRPILTKGDVVRVSGFASPRSYIRVELDGQRLFASRADDVGAYSMLIPTADVSFGRHWLRVKQKAESSGVESDFSPTKSVLVSKTTVPKADLTGDGEVTVTDWSIYLAAWKTKQREADLTGEGIVDISDLSIFLRAL